MALDPDAIYERCAACKGQGVTTKGEVVTICRHCNGHGYVEHTHR